MRTALKVLAIVLLGTVLASFEAFAIAEVVNGRGADIFVVNRYGFAVTWMYASIDGAVGCLALLVVIVANAIYRWRRKHGY
jgi:hypothetical protein